MACKEAANENDETRKRFEVMCREVFKKFKACINVEGVNAYRADRDAINIVYKSLQQDREQADITDIIRQLHQVVDEAIETQPDPVGEEREPYDISKIDFERLKQEFERSPAKEHDGPEPEAGHRAAAAAAAGNRTRCAPTSSSTTRRSSPSTTARRTG